MICILRKFQAVIWSLLLAVWKVSTDWLGIWRSKEFANWNTFEIYCYFLLLPRYQEWYSFQVNGLKGQGVTGTSLPLSSWYLSLDSLGKRNRNEWKLSVASTIKYCRHNAFSETFLIHNVFAIFTALVTPFISWSLRL